MSTITPRDDIEGWFDWMDLYKAMLDRANNNAHFVEVGSWMGKSACYMAEHIKQSGKQIKFDCVDIWDDNSTEIAYRTMMEHAKKLNMTLLEVFKGNLAKYGVFDRVNAIKTTSANAAMLYADGSLDMVFIDASHDFDNVMTDLKAWYPKVRSGGEFAGHDYFYSVDGVQRAVKEFCSANKIKFDIVGQCWYVKKGS